MTRADRNISWVESYCRIPEGRDVGKPVILREWQKDEIRRIYDNPAGTRQAIISFPRKNGKTALISFLLLLHLCGPEAKPNSQLYSAAQSREQAAVVFGLASKTVRMSPDLNAVIQIRDTAKEILCPEIGTKYGALSADAATAHGRSPIFVVHDELGQVRGPASQLFEALETGMGAHDAPLSIIISTQAPTDADLLSKLIDDAQTGRDPKTTVSVYSADKEADPFSEDTLRACNPAWGDFLNAGEVLRTMEQAKALPSAEAGYRNLHLNQRIEVNNTFVSRAAWLGCNAAPNPLDGLTVYGGLDLSSTSDLTALVLIGHDGEAWNVEPTFWLPGDGLPEKSRQDRVPYDVWYREGYLQGAPGKSVDYAYVAEWLLDVFERYDMAKLAFDRWGFKYLHPWLIEAGFDEETIEQKFEPFGQGFQSMSPALRYLEAEIVNGRLRHGGHPVLTMCASNAVVQADPAGNRKLAKHKSTGRIDGLQALAMAMGVAPMRASEATSVNPYEDRGLRALAV